MGVIQAFQGKTLLSVGTVAAGKEKQKKKANICIDLFVC